MLVRNSSFGIARGVVCFALEYDEWNHESCVLSCNSYCTVTVRDQ